jgi:prolyl oligopeptidase PreP (S9A serine peptidase family)
MKPHKHVIVVKIDLDRKSFTRQGVHMNNSGKDKIAFKIANVVTKIFLKQEEIIRLHWKNEYEDSISDSSNEDNILQEDSKTAPSGTANVEALITNDAAKDELIYKEPIISKRKKKPPTIRSDDFLW